MCVFAWGKKLITGHIVWKRMSERVEGRKSQKGKRERLCSSGTCPHHGKCKYLPERKGGKNKSMLMHQRMCLLERMRCARVWGREAPQTSRGIRRNELLRWRWCLPHVHRHALTRTVHCKVSEYGRRGKQRVLEEGEKRNTRFCVLSATATYVYAESLA